MKRILFVLVGVLFFNTSCIKMTEEKVRSFVLIYYLDFGEFHLRNEDNNNISVVWTLNTGDYRVDWKSTGRQKEIYDSLCTVNNDLDYNQTIRYMVEPIGGKYFGGNIDKISVVSNADFDELHPAGEPLDDIVRLLSVSPYKYIESGYRETYDWDTEYGTAFSNQIRSYLAGSKEGAPMHFPIDVLLSEIKEGDLKLMGLGGGYRIGQLKFEKKPEQVKEHLLTVSITTKEGKEFSAQLTKLFE